MSHLLTLEYFQNKTSKNVADVLYN